MFRKRKNLSVKSYTKEFASPLNAFRWICDDDRGYSSLRFTERERRLWELRWRLAIRWGYTNHNTYSIYFAHWKPAAEPKLAAAFRSARHDLFAQGYKGKHGYVDDILQKNYPNDPDIPPQLCYTNPDTAAYYGHEAAVYFRGGNVPGGYRNFSGRIPSGKTIIPRFPGLPFYYPVEGGDSNQFCLCPKCQKLFAGLKGDEYTSNMKFHSHPIKI